MEGRSIASSYLLPYQEHIKEPTLAVPMMPDLGPLPEPLPPRRPPPPGYDMKTYRRQIEYLQDEINSRIDNYNAVCHQNEKLFSYVQELVKANDFNVNNMKEYCRKVHEELRLVKRERAQLVEKLEFMVNSKRLLAELGQELKEKEVTTEEMVQRRQEAEDALRQAIAERQHAEDELHDKVDQMRDYEKLLDRYKLQSEELRKLEEADEFFFTNRAVLRSAYHRFKDGVRRRMRLSKLREGCRFLQHMFQKVECWRQWKHFIECRRYFKAFHQRRAEEATRLAWARWKVCASYEQMMHRFQRVVRLRVGFKRFKQHTTVAKFWKWADESVVSFQEGSLLRDTFRSWKRQTLFLDWFTPKTRIAEAEASSYFKQKLFTAWRAVAHVTRQRHEQQTAVVHLRRVARHLHEWRWLCKRQWKVRGRLLRRFLTVARQRLSIRAYYSGLERKAKLFHWQYGKLALFRRWRRVTQHRKQFVLLANHRTMTNGTGGLIMGSHRGGGGAGSMVAGGDGGSGGGGYSSRAGQWPPSTPRLTGTALSAWPPATPMTYGALSAHGAAVADEIGSAVSSRLDLHALATSRDPSDDGGAGVRRDFAAAASAIAEDPLHDAAAVLVHVSPLAQQRHKDTQRIVTYYYTRLLKQHFVRMALQLLGAHTRRMHHQLAQRHHLARRVRHATLQWHTWTVQQRAVRHVEHVLARRYSFGRWRRAVAHALYRRRLVDGLARIRERTQRQRVTCAWQAWGHSVDRARWLAIAWQQVTQRQRRSTVQRWWIRWHGQYLSRMVWKVKELDIDVRRVEALHALQEQTVVAKEAECQRLHQETQSLEAELAHTKALLAEREAAVAAQHRWIEEQRLERQRLEDNLQVLQRQIQETEAEQARWQALEASMIQQRSLEASERAKKYAEVNQKIHLLQEEQQFLQQSLRTQAQAAHQAQVLAQYQVDQAVVEYQQAEDDVQQLTHEVDEETKVIEALTAEQEGLYEVLSQLQQKTKEMVHEANAITHDTNTRVRQQAAAVDVLTADAGVARARVVAMLELVEEADRAQGRAQMADVETVELRETQEMRALQQAFTEKMRRVEQMYIDNRLHGGGMAAPAPYTAPSASASPRGMTTTAMTMPPRSQPQPQQPAAWLTRAEDVSSVGSSAPSLSRGPTATNASAAVPPPTTPGGAVPPGTAAKQSISPSIMEETLRLDRQYADARDAIRSLASRLTRPLPTDAPRPPL